MTDAGADLGTAWVGGGGWGGVSTGWAGREDEVPKKFDNMQLGGMYVCVGEGGRGWGWGVEVGVGGERQDVLNKMKYLNDL